MCISCYVRLLIVGDLILSISSWIPPYFQQNALFHFNSNLGTHGQIGNSLLKKRSSVRLLPLKLKFPNTEEEDNSLTHPNNVPFEQQLKNYEDLEIGDFDNSEDLTYPDPLFSHNGPVIEKPRSRYEKLITLPSYFPSDSYSLFEKKGNQAITIIDSHFEVWSDGSEPYPWFEGREPLPSIKDVCTEDIVLGMLNYATLKGALLVQSHVHGYDHSYIESLIQSHPDKFKGIAKLNPNRTADAIALDMDEFKQKKGFSGFMINCTEWAVQLANVVSADQLTYQQGDYGDVTQKVTRGKSTRLIKQVMRRAGFLKLPLSFSCSNGFDVAARAVEKLALAHPHTTVVLDHLGYVLMTSRSKPIESVLPPLTEPDWDRLLVMANIPNLYIKLSGMFKVSLYQFPHMDVQRRIMELIDAYGAKRILFGTDYPNPLVEHPNVALGFVGYVRMLFDWRLPLDPSDFKLMVRGNAERLYGEWGSKMRSSKKTISPPPAPPAAHEVINPLSKGKSEEVMPCKNEIS